MLFIYYRFFITVYLFYYDVGEPTGHYRKSTNGKFNPPPLAFQRLTIKITSDFSFVLKFYLGQELVDYSNLTATLVGFLQVFKYQSVDF